MTLKEVWKSDFQADIHRKMWDGAAEDYLQKPIPAIEEHDFLSLIQQRGVLGPQTSVLDVGCGAGRLTLALAPHVGRAVGCDLSPRMIEGATAHAASLSCDNAEFFCMDWHTADPDALGWCGAFDVVFAHHTPAVSDYDTFDKLARCAKKHGFFRLNTRRHDEVLEQALACVGLAGGRDGRADSVPCAFAYLWQRGYQPQVSYRQEVWRPVKTLPAQIDWCLSRARLRRALTGPEEAAIADYLRSVAVDGLVQETITTTVVTLDWAL